MSQTIAAEQQQLQELIADTLNYAKSKGASQAEAAMSRQTGISVSIRKQNIETLEFNRDGALGITVYFGHKKGNASTSDLRPEALKVAVDAACNIAKYTSEDPFSGPADAEQMPESVPDLQLYHPGSLDPENAIELAMRCEQAAFDTDPRINNSDGATFSSHESVRLYGNSHGFIAGYPSTRHSLSCVTIAKEGDDMQRDYSYSISRQAERLWLPERVGEHAAQRTINRLNARKLGTRKVPVIFASDLASGLFGHLVSAISGGNLYRNASFLKDRLGEQIMPDHLSIVERPLIPCALASAPFDSEGVATQDRMVVEQGVLSTYLLSAYSARKLNMENTGHAGGIYNWLIRHGGRDFDDLLAEMGTGLLVTEVMGQGVNTVTGDYSRGASGFWVENGQLAYPVHEITIASNLKDMFKNIVRVGSDLDRRGQIQTGSVLISEMQIAGQ
ncbi:metalloprotease PmbA [Echinimonas agarilytica]|uniref:Metalloprotease PmbA n=1 Tax=Echinimonas agarilytica TaxID=1215918 RepID=A0AA41W4J2_9GAMM|nr:metalloprotease PmbA [Echinimonas agarilytica]MCM2678603.1 metalloprotease PmbA [Echinimonas agarilytica]